MTADWTFESGVAESFDSYVRGQLPFYDLATQAVADIVRLHLPQGGCVVDVGASTGNVGRAIEHLLTARAAHLIAVEPADEMRSAYVGPGVVVNDTAQTYEMPWPDVIVSFLTLAFVPPADRSDCLHRWQTRIRPGGALVVVERVHVGPAALTCRHLIHAAKARAGECEGDVLAKEVSIAGVLRPLPADLLPYFGGELFFAYGDFRGYVIEVEG